MNDPAGRSVFDAPPGARDAAIAEEQAHLETVVARVDVLRAQAERRHAELAGDRLGSTFQAQFERDVSAFHQAQRAARFTFGDVESMLFGRLDLADGDRLHIGKISVVDESGEVILVDWRAPAAAAFYRATMAQPLDIARRRTLSTRGRVVRDLDDEILDADAAERLGLTAVTGQGALLAALTRDRRHTMQDIVATIQADQDAIIRAPARGVLVVTGGPGTGKTVVALHRVAYLLYDDRERFEGRGVLVVGPTTAFTEYTSVVLPSLGEDRAVQRSLSSLVPTGTRVDGWDAPEIGEIKGDARMAGVCRRALAATMPAIAADVSVQIDGVAARVSAAALTSARDRLLARITAEQPERTYRSLAEVAEEAMVRVVWTAWRRAALASGRRHLDDRPPPGWRDLLAGTASVRMLARSFWPVRHPGEVLMAFAGDAALVRDVVGAAMDPEAGQRLAAAWAGRDGFTLDDAALLDELDALIGVDEPNDERDEDPGLRVTGDARSWPEKVDIAAPAYRDFAHVVIDEAQDLSPMQWRSLARRGAYASWTIVGDLSQRSRAGAPIPWDDLASLVGRRELAVYELTVNYRTPDEIAQYARAVLADAGLPTEHLPSAVRRMGRRPRLVRTTEPYPAIANLVNQLASAHDGTIAVITPAERVGMARDMLGQLDDVLARRTRVFDARGAKGLEFDDVIVVEPDAIGRSAHAGPQNLYVAVTRATRSLTLVAAPNADVPAVTLLDERRESRTR